VVDDLAEAKEFATSKLGLELVREIDVPERGMRAAFFAAGDVQIEYLELTEAYEEGRRALRGEPARIDHLAFAVDDAGETFEELEAKGISFRTSAPDGVAGATFFFTKPETSDGVLYQFLEEPS
jgi:catechol 2,3-dioxygenase-like lactoylglutathione lyase family enzyme